MLAAVLLAGCGVKAPSDLRCEHQKGEVVVEYDAVPRLSWIDPTEQSAWQIIVSKDRKRSGESLVWDSGKVVSDESHLVSYGGPALEPMKDYYWSVRIWDKDGKASSWSKPTRWTTGPAKDGWDEEWIGASWQEDTRGYWYTRYPVFRKEFEVGPGLEEAKVFISGLGYFEARVNGKKVGNDFLVPGLTDYTLRPFLAENPRIPLDPEVTSYRTLYLCYDISDMLRKGSNAIGVTLGNGYFHTRPTAQSAQCEPYGAPRLIARIELTYKDGHTEHVSTDTSWKSSRSPYIYGDVWGGEVYDAREEMPGWDKAGFDDYS